MSCVWEQLWVVLVLVFGVCFIGAQNPQCVHKGGQTESGLKDLFESYGQNILALSVPRKLESHFHFADLHPRDPFLWGFVRSMEDNGHDQFFEAIKSAWFEKAVDGVLEFDCSVEDQGLTSVLKDNIMEQLTRCPESIIIFRRAHLCSVITLLADFIQDVAESSTGVPRTTSIGGNKAIFILEIVLGPGRGSDLLPYLKEDSISENRGSLGAIDKALALQNDIVKEYFGQWRAFSTRLWVTWVQDLSQETKFRMYQKKIKKIRENYEERGYFINFEVKQQQLHFSSLSPAGKGIMKWDHEEDEKVVFFSEAEFVKVMEKCPVGENEIVWEYDTNTSSLTCNSLKMKEYT